MSPTFCTITTYLSDHRMQNVLYLDLYKVYKMEKKNIKKMVHSGIGIDLAANWEPKMEAPIHCTIVTNLISSLHCCDRSDWRMQNVHLYRIMLKIIFTSRQSSGLVEKEVL